MSLKSAATGCYSHTAPSCRPAVSLKSAFQTPYAAAIPSAALPHPSAPSASLPHHTAGDAPVRMLLLHHPLQATFCSSMYSISPVQAVRDGHTVLPVLKAVVQSSGLTCSSPDRYHHTGSGPPASLCMVGSHHPPGVLRIISKPVHRCPAAVIHRPQFSAGRVRAACQRRSRLFIRAPGRVSATPGSPKPDTVIGTVFCTGGQRVGES